MRNLVIRMTADDGRLQCTTNIIDGNEQDVSRYEALLERLITSVQGSAAKDYGYCDPEKVTPFHEALQHHCAQQNSAADTSTFDTLATALSQQLQTHFTGLIETAEPYYLWLSQAGDDSSNPVGLFLLKQEAGYFFGEDLQLMQTQCIEPSRVKYSAIVDPVEWQTASNRYITLKAPKSTDPLSAAFQNLLSFVAGVDRKADTEEILEMIEQYTNDVVPDQKKEVASRVFQYCTDQDRQGQSVNVQALSDYIDAEAPESFVEFVSSNLDSPREDWHPDRRQIQRHTNFFGRDQNISIRFSSLCFGDDIVYDEGSNSLTIKSLPKSLIAQIKRYLRKAS
jgi:nucleoid-associated protein